jgi:predicted  nucleic acid-binding Zn-ribbon protein
MMGESSEIPPKHKWKSIEGQTVESNSTFPPFKGIVLEDNNRQVKAVPLLLSEEAIQLSGIDKRVQSVSEQINWTNTALRGMATHTFVTNDYARKGQIIDLQVSTNTIVHSVNEIQDKVTDVKDKMDSTLSEISSKSRESLRNHEELMEGLGKLSLKWESHC